MKNPRLFFYIAAIGWIGWASGFPFFWDTIQLASKHAHFFYENNLTWAPLPPDIDSGHPPFLGYLLAIGWTIFGKNIAVGHWIMLPFILLIINILYRFSSAISGPNLGYWILPLVLLDPVFLGQSVLVTPDIMLLAWMLLTLDGLLNNRRILVIIGVIGLTTVSMRGMMVATAIAGAEIWIHRRSIKRIMNSLVAFIPGAIIGFLFLYWHWISTGWIGHHPNSTWSPAFKPVDTMGYFRNIAIVGWRWLDFGRFAVFIGLGGGIYALWKQNEIYKKILENKIFTRVIVHFLVIFLALTLPALYYQNLSAHRYFLPAFTLFTLLFFGAITQVSSMNNLKKTWICAAISLCLAAGNWWIYPRGISMDWDATLAHVPYHNLRIQACHWLDQQGISYDQVGSAFPNKNTGENLYLNGDLRRFTDFDLTKNEYVMVSNIFNDIGPKEYEVLETHWKLRVKFAQHGIWIMIFEQP